MDRKEWVKMERKRRRQDRGAPDLPFWISIIGMVVALVVIAIVQ